MKIIYIDLDGVVADFEKGRSEHPLSTITPYKGRPDKLPGVYENLEPITGAIDAVNFLLNSEDYDVYFLSTAPMGTIQRHGCTKRLWIAKNTLMKN